MENKLLQLSSTALMICQCCEIRPSECMHANAKSCIPGPRSSSAYFPFLQSSFPYCINDPLRLEGPYSSIEERVKFRFVAYSSIEERMKFRFAEDEIKILQKDFPKMIVEKFHHNVNLILIKHSNNEINTMSRCNLLDFL